MHNRVLALLLLLTLCLPASLHAQDPQPEVIVLHSTATEQDGLDMSVYFVVRGEDGRPIAPNKIEAAKLQLRDDREPVFATLGDPTTPIKILLVLDASGSMINFLEPVKAAAIDSISKAPPNAEFAVTTFADMSSADPFEPALGFTGERAQVEEFIRSQYSPQDGAPTCLFTAAFKASEYLAATMTPEERRAIILFTDGRDERLGGGPCSDRALQDVLRQAGESRVPIYTIGLCTDTCANLDEPVLTRMASQTNAISRLGTTQQISGAFFEIMDDIASQKIASATILPCQERQATLLVSVIGVSDELRGVVPLPQAKCYAPRGTVTVNEFQRSEDVYNLSMSIDNDSPVTLSQLAINVLGPNNTLVYSATIDQPVAQNDSGTATTTVPLAQLRQEGQHTLQILARSEDGYGFLTEDDGEATEVLASYPFSHEPFSNVQVKIDSIPRIDHAAGTLTIDTISILAGQELLADKKGFIKAQLILLQDDTPKFQSEEVLFDLEKPSLTIPLSALPDGLIPTEAPVEYRAQVRLTAPGSIEATSEPLPFDFAPVPQAGFFEKYGIFLGIALLLPLLGLAAWYALRQRSTRRRPEIPRPYSPPTQLLQLPPEHDVHPHAGPGAADMTMIAAPPPTAMLSQPAPAALPQPRLAIKVLKTDNPAQIREQTFFQFPIVLGRANSDFPILGDGMISRKHAEISRQGADFYITDLGSTNGAFINEQRLAPNTPVLLNGRTQLRLGQNTVVELMPLA